MFVFVMGSIKYYFSSMVLINDHSFHVVFTNVSIWMNRVTKIKNFKVMKLK